MAVIMQKLLAFILLFLTPIISDFSGTYEATKDGDHFTITLKQSGTQLSGEATGHGATFTLDGKVDGNHASGKLTLKEGDLKIYFKAAIDGDSLKMTISEDESFKTTDETTFTRTKKEGEPKLSKEPTGTLKNGKEYVHPSGGKFKYPADWKLDELDGALKLTPPDAQEGEAYLVLAEQAQGATDPGTPEILAYLDSQVQAQLPFMKRTGQPEKATAGAGKGVMLIWDGKSADKEIRVRAYVTILKGYGVALVAAGPKDRIDAKDKILREIFYTFGWGQGKLDTNLVGEWTYWGYKGSSNYGYGKETRAYAVLRADGTFSYSNDSETAISASTGSLVSRRGSGWNGTWTADGTTLFLNFEDGTSDSFPYKFKQEGQNVFLQVTGSDGKAMDWSKK